MSTESLTAIGVFLIAVCVAYGVFLLDRIARQLDEIEQLILLSPKVDGARAGIHDTQNEPKPDNPEQSKRFTADSDGNRSGFPG